MWNDITVSILLFVGAFYLYFFEMNKIKVMSEGAYSLLLPRIILILIMVFSSILGLKSFSQTNVNTNKRHSTNWKIVAVVGLSILYIYGMNIVGYFFVTPMFVFVFSYILGYKKYVISIGFSIVLTFVIYILFVEILYVPLPAGIGLFKNINEIIMF